MDLTLWKGKLDAYLDPQEGDMLRLLERIVNMDSFTTDAQDVDQLGTVLTDWLREAGFQTFMMPKTEAPADEPWQADLGHVFMAKTHGREAEPGIVFLGHMDTVFPKGTAQARPFKIEGDRATGPGVADMKAGLVANLFAARALKRLGLIDCPMTLMFSPDEELGSPSASRTLAQVLPGARAAINSEPGGPGGLVTVSRKGSGHMVLKVQGKASHAGRCYADGASAILEIAHKTLAIDTFLDLDRGLTVNTGLISGGVSANSVAPWAESRIHLTYRTLEDGQKVVAGIRDAVSRTVIPGTSASISGGLRLYPFEHCEAGDKLFGLVKDAGELLGMSIKGQHYDSASEAGFSSSLGVPTICNMGPEGEHIHSLNEYLVPSSIVKRCKLIALTALQASRVFQPGK